MSNGRATGTTEDTGDYKDHSLESGRSAREREMTNELTDVSATSGRLVFLDRASHLQEEPSSSSAKDYAHRSRPQPMAHLDIGLLRKDVGGEGGAGGVPAVQAYRAVRSVRLDHVLR